MPKCTENGGTLQHGVAEYKCSKFVIKYASVSAQRLGCRQQQNDVASASKNVDFNEMCQYLSPLVI